MALARLRDLVPRDDAVLLELLRPVPGLSAGARHPVDVSTFREIVFSDPCPEGQRRPAGQRGPRDLASLLAEMLNPSETCAICLADFVQGDRLRVLPCEGAHTFHGECLTRWLSLKPTCPFCRANVQPEPVALDLDIARQVLQQRSSRGGSTADVQRRSSAPRSHSRTEAAAPTGSRPRLPVRR
mmetsp:Transcript_3677/g.11154  ORF Transcript_3677/g.11154 Transcript_3677/m.11154 type:complete len:184 (-) Transcript_3677:530-1081(-)